MSMPKSYAEIGVKENWLFWRNSRHMVAVTSASPKLLWCKHALLVFLAGGRMQI